MPPETQAMGAGRTRWNTWPEVLIAVLASAVFLGGESTIGFPSALCGLVSVALVLALGRRMGGESVGRAAALVLCSTAFFVREMRQVSNDAPLALFTTLALYAAWRRLQDGNPWGQAAAIKLGPLRGDAAAAAPGDSRREAPQEGSGEIGTQTGGSSLWSFVFCAALGHGFLCKGPVIFVLVFVALVPYLAFSGRLVWGMRRLAFGWGPSLVAIVALGYTILVVRDPQASRVWMWEFAEKAGMLRIALHGHHQALAAQWPALVLPWTLIAGCALALPVISGLAAAGSKHRNQGTRARGAWVSPIWLAWWWAIGNLAIFSAWKAAQPSDYLPCLPAMALLTGAAWVQLTRAARASSSTGAAARAILQTQWVLLFVAAAAAPLFMRPLISWPTWIWSVAIALALAVSVALSARAWRRGADELALAPITVACVFGILIACALVAPAENSQRDGRTLVRTAPAGPPRITASTRSTNEPTRR